MNTEENDTPLPGADAAADSTQFRRRAERDTAPAAPAPSQRPLAPDTAHPGAGKSIRFHSRTPRSSLAVRMSLPIILCLIASFGILCLFAREHVQKMALGNLEADAENLAYTGSLFGRLLVTHHDAFLRGNPDYLRRAEWRAGDYWLVTQGFVSEKDWEDATGFESGELAPSSAMLQAGRRAALADMEAFLNSPAAGTEIVAFAILGADGLVLASCRKNGFDFDEAVLRTVPRSGRRRMSGNAIVSADSVDAFEPAPVVRATAEFFADGGEGGEGAEGAERRLLGAAVVVIRADGRLSRAADFSLLLAGIAASLVPAMAFVCWLSSRRVSVPLKRLAADMQAIAEGDYARRSAVRENDETGLAAQAFNSMAERLRLARVNAQETSRLESDLAIARGIQNNLLPQQTPRVRGLDIHTSYRPAKEIGGDYFDFLPIDGERMGLVVADASGKSIPAALVMSTTRAILRFIAPGVRSAAETLTKVNAILSVDIPHGMFVTAYYVILEPLNNTMLCASAGHNPLLIARRDGSVELMNPGGIALGFDGGAIFERSIREQRVRLEQGDRVLLYTDGVVECVNPTGEEYSDRRLREFVRRNRDLSSRDFVGALMADLDRHRGTAEMRDDTTVVTFKVL